MGINGKTQGKSVISFDFSTNESASLNMEMYPCGTKVPADGIFDGYKL